MTQLPAHSPRRPGGSPGGPWAGWLAVVLALLAGMVAFLFYRAGKPEPPATLFGVVEEAEKTVEIPPPAPPPDAGPPPPSPKTVALPDQFPASVGSFHLESSRKEGGLAGVDSYFVARYCDPHGEIVSVRLLGVPEGEGPRFAQLAGRHLAESGSSPRGKAGAAGGLFERGGAGILVGLRGRMLVVVSASSPEAAEAFANDLLPPVPSRAK